MTHAQSLELRAIHASKFLGSFQGWNEGTMFVESLKSRHDIQTVEISFTPTITSGVIAGIGSMSAGVIRALQNPSSGHPFYKMGNVLLSTTGIERNEIANYPAAFDELHELRTDKTKFLAALKDLKSQVAIHERESIVHRLETLLVDFQDDYDRALDANSLRTLIALLSLYPKLKRPSITADENGNLFAEWKSEDGKRSLGLLILPMRQVRFVAFRPDTLSPMRKKYVSGLSSVEELFTDLASYDILSWACAA